MKTFLVSLHALSLAAALLSATGCEAIDPGGTGRTAAPDDDPLAIADDLTPGTLDALHRDVIAGSCAAQPGLCHHGQFEPNLSTPALMYENLVLRPGLEHATQYRVDPAHPKDGLLLDKLTNHNVLSQMPLGADPLSQEEIAAVEKWIADGALRRPGADPPPVLNNPPREPEIGVFDDKGNQLDKAGPCSVTAGTTLTLRHSVQDFETEDAKIPYAAILLQLPDGSQLKLSDAPGGETSAVTQYQPSGAPQGKGDSLDFHFDWTVPDTIDVYGPDGKPTPQSTAGMSLTVLVLYIDSAVPNEGMLTFTIAPDLIEVTP